MAKIRQDIEENLTTDYEAYEELPEVIQEKLEWFKDQKIGVIFHWGLYAVAGIVESWQMSEEDDWARKNPWRNDIDELRADYWGLNHSFNPYQFNPTAWAQACKDAGFRYMLFTTKHHDGFNMYDTAYSEYKVTQTPCPFAENPQADVFGAVAEAFREVGLSVGAYYSKPDWHSPLYWVPGERPKGRYASYDPHEFPERWAQYNQFVHDQLVEITTNYGELDILWLDGGWVNSRHELLDMDRIAQAVRTQQQDLLIVDRSIGGKYENYVTPERKIPEIPPTKAWESNIPLAKNWGFCPNDTYKSFEEILTSVVQVVAMGGNIILGVGPKPDGTLPREALAILEPLGEWLTQFGEGIYETRPSTYKAPHGWSFTQKGTVIYAFGEKNAPDLSCQLFGAIERITLLNTGEVISDPMDELSTGEELYQVYKIELTKKTREQ